MKKLYLSLYLLVFMALIGLSWVIDSIYQNIDEPNNNGLKQSEQIFTSIKLKIEKDLNTSITNGLPSLFEIEKTSTFTWPKPLVDRLMKGEIVVLNSDEGVTFHQLLKHDRFVLSMGPIQSAPLKNSVIRYGLTALFYFGIALILLLWFWPLIKAVMHLSKALKRVAKGKLQTRLGNKTLYLSELFKDFNKMAQKLELLNENNQLFSQAVSHDIRTPLSRILFALDKLESHQNNDIKKLTISIHQDVEKIELLTKELLQYSRLEQDQQVQLDFIDVTLLAEQVMAGFDYENIKLDLNTHLIPDKLPLDANLLQKILNNLLSNALRFCKSKINISLSYHLNYLIIKVEDDGMGIDFKEKTANDYCQPFVQNKRNDKHFGLGLAIILRAVKLMQGDLAMDNLSQSGGARFTVSLPLKTHS